MTDDTQAAPVHAAGAAAPPTDHTAADCCYSWCKAHGVCRCPYAQASPHRAEHCRYNDDQEQAADE